jgi:hypothetical protein
VTEAELEYERGGEHDSAGRDREALVDVLELARTRIDAPEIERYARSLESYTRELA